MPRLVPTFRPPASRRRVIACLACLAVQRPELGLRDVPGPNAAFRVERYQIRPEDEQRRDGGVVVVIQSRRSERAQPVRAPADDDRRADPDEREVVAARQRGDVRAALAAKLRPHQFQSHLLAVVNLERPPRGDGHERLRAPAVHRERRALGDVPERARTGRTARLSPRALGVAVPSRSPPVASRAPPRARAPPHPPRPDHDRLFSWHARRVGPPRLASSRAPSRPAPASKRALGSHAIRRVSRVLARG